jgi:hypothetical protein
MATFVRWADGAVVELVEAGNEQRAGMRRMHERRR